MFCDALRLLRGLRPTEQYRYIGLGHWQFVDFELMRREVGVRSMISIERNTSDKARFEGNKPFAEVELLFGETFEQLQELDLNIPTIAWLDYTSKLDAGVLRDLRMLTEQLPAGSVIAATVNCKPDREDERLDALIRVLGSDVVPGDVSEGDLNRNGLPRIQRRILSEQLQAVARARTPPGELMQFMYLRYADGSPMLFWAGVLIDDTVRELVEALPFRRLEQFRGGDDPLEVAVPPLSTREVIDLNSQIRAGQVPSVQGVTAQDCAAYAQFHRWYPAVPLPF